MLRNKAASSNAGPRVVGILIACLLPVTAAAQEERPVFRATTNLVDLTIVALDKQGRPVRDLRKEELRVYDQGKPREISFYHYDGAEDLMRPAKPKSAGFYSNATEYLPGPARNVTAIVLDSLNTAPADQVRVRAQTIRSLRTMADRTRVAVFHLGAKLSILHDFTDDTDSLRQRLERWVPQPEQISTIDLSDTTRDAELIRQLFAGNPTIAELMDKRVESEMLFDAMSRKRRTELTLEALDVLGTHLSGIPGRKSLVWIGGGISMLAVYGAGGVIESLESKVQDAARRLAQRGVVLYWVDAAGVQVASGTSAAISSPPPRSGMDSYERQKTAAGAGVDPLPASMKLASITGGRIIRNTNDLSEGMRQAADDLAGSYSIAFAAASADGKWHDIRVETTRPNVSLTYRSGFQAEPAKTTALSWTADEWKAAIYNPLGSSAIGLEARCTAPVASAMGTVTLTVRIDASGVNLRRTGSENQADIEIGIADKSPAGVLGFYHENGRIDVPENPEAAGKTRYSTYTRTWKPAEGATGIRVLVRDRISGRYGTLDVKLEGVTSAPGDR